ncbi:hypothetical protein QFZ22_000691 [Streptomyces canus]|uniref:Mutator family transposase n=1 Tax=Streptomyces canus TaxID=58343 RepID=A0AAW8F625_9ACTN|nr:hypothetical protein [Streptomyces canus]
MSLSKPPRPVCQKGLLICYAPGRMPPQVSSPAGSLSQTPVVSQAAVIATGISATGHHEILGVRVGDSESKPFWTKFLRSLRARGLENVQLVISDSHSVWWPRSAPSSSARPGKGAGFTSSGTCFRRAGLRRDGRRHYPHDLRADHTRAGAHPAGRGRRHARTAIPTGQGDAAGCGNRHHRVRRLPAGALEEDLVDGRNRQGGRVAGQRRGWRAGGACRSGTWAATGPPAERRRVSACSAISRSWRRSCLLL